ncbi:MAG: hypothetical protein INR81_20735 [Microcystis aeruginosa PMC 728.11]|nr:hypothetical protein [Microcystis aeruginosa PMC 728.11]
MPNKEPIRQFVRIIFSGEVGNWWKWEVGNGAMGKWEVGSGEVGNWGSMAADIQLKP